MTSKNSITKEEKEVLEYLYEVANNVCDFLHRKGFYKPVSITVEANHKGYPAGEPNYDMRSVDFWERYENDRTKRIVGMDYDQYADRASIHEYTYEDKDDE
jgi:hypothetical protein